MSKVLVLHGPNLNMLGEREPAIYGGATLASITSRLESIAADAGVAIESLQSNDEAELINTAQKARSAGIDFILINPAAFTHSSIALRDALSAVGLPFIEIHLSNVYAREPFRHQSYFSDIAVGVITGLGAHGSEYALRHAIHLLTQSNN